MPIRLTNPATCIACRMRQAACVCDFAPRVRIATRLIVIIHSKEWRRTTNTGHFARLAVQGAEVRVHGSPKHRISSAGIKASPSTLVLYPGRGARVLSPESIASLPRPLTLLVPDGNWNQAQHMMRRLPMLRQATPVCLAGSSLDMQTSRRNRIADRMSTFEAIAQALGILEGHETSDDLMTFFRQILIRITGNAGQRAARLPDRPIAHFPST